MKLHKFSITSVIFALLALCELSHAHYSPELGNFLSRDPIEEDGGVNLYAFAERDPVNKWDDLGLRPKLTAVESQPFKPGKCGAFSWKIKWQVDTPSSVMLGGQILQDVETIIDIKNCDGHSKLGYPKNMKFSEVWRVLPGSTTINGLDYVGIAGVTSDEDLFQAPDMGVCTTGKITMIGYARYYSAQLSPENWGTGLGLLKTVFPYLSNHRNGTNSGNLLSHPQNPNWTKGADTSELVKHSIVVKWNCCPNPPKKMTEKIYSTIE